MTTKLEVFEVVVPKDGDKPEKRYYFTTEHEPVTWKGQQYIPLSVFDAAKWLPSRGYKCTCGQLKNPCRCEV